MASASRRSSPSLRCARLRCVLTVTRYAPTAATAISLATSSSSVDKPTPQREPVRHSPLGVAAEQLGHQIVGTPKGLLGGGRAVVKAVGNFRSTAHYLSSLARVAGPPPKNPSTILRGGSRRMWRFGTMECEFDDLKRAAKSAGGSLNDAFVSALLGGLRRYCSANGEELEDVPISMPVAMRLPTMPRVAMTLPPRISWCPPASRAPPSASVRCASR